MISSVRMNVLNYLLGRESVTPFQTDSYGAAHAAGLLPLMWLAFVVAAPLGEEMPGGLALEGRSWLR